METGPKKMEADQVPESELPPVPEDDDLNATVIEVMTDVEVLLGGSSVRDVFAVNSARRKRVQVSERKLQESHACEMGPDMEVDWKRQKHVCVCWAFRIQI